MFDKISQKTKGHSFRVYTNGRDFGTQNVVKFIE